MLLCVIYLQDSYNHAANVSHISSLYIIIQENSDIMWGSKVTSFKHVWSGLEASSAYSIYLEFKSNARVSVACGLLSTRTSSLQFSRFQSILSYISMVKNLQLLRYVCCCITAIPMVTVATLELANTSESRRYYSFGIFK